MPVTPFTMGKMHCHLQLSILCSWNLLSDFQSGDQWVIYLVKKQQLFQCDNGNILFSKINTHHKQCHYSIYTLRDKISLDVYIVFDCQIWDGFTLMQIKYHIRLDWDGIVWYKCILDAFLGHYFVQCNSPYPQQAGTSAIPHKYRALLPLPTCTERDHFW